LSQSSKTLINEFLGATSKRSLTEEFHAIMLISIGLAASSLLLIGLVLQDGFMALLLPRRVTRTYYLARLYYIATWRLWAAIGRRMRSTKSREEFLSFYGPLSMIVLFGVWATGLIVGFALLNQSLGTPLNTPGGTRHSLDYLYMSGVTLFTLGFGDVTPSGPIGRMIAVVEAGIGFGFLAAVIGYLPVLYGAFSRRELPISLLDARGGSPPTAVEILRRIGPTRQVEALGRYLEEWERWSGEVLESHLSFPVLTYYRSQHNNQSWLAALTAVLDTCAIIMSQLKDVDPFQAQLTFAMARHAAVDLAQIYRSAPLPLDSPRLSEDDGRRLRELLHAAGLEVREGPHAFAKFAEIRGMYEPFVSALARHFVLSMPPIMVEGTVVDNWQTSAWMRRTNGLVTLALDDHDD